MTDRQETRPSVPPQGDYRAAIVHNGLVYSAGMTPRVAGTLQTRGLVGRDLSLAEAQQAAALAASNALRAVAEAAGGLDRIERCLRMTVFLACTEEFTAHSAVADGASAALRAWLGDRGAVVRSAVGVRCLPSGAPVEVELTAAVG
ncbi:RidA family protein [Prauserella oleivorans]|uniref:RidA family protein n=1 Tax=Prauserella oleivorans TaxID=1478153 RepID=A0ABW5WCB1_9PSEU